MPPPPNSFLMGVEPISFLNLVQYMIILFVVFVLQFSVSCACLAVNKDQQVGFYVLPSRSNSAEDHSGHRFPL